MGRYFRKYKGFTRCAVSGKLNYRGALIMDIINSGVSLVASLFLWFALFHNISSVAGWSMYEVALLYGCVMFSEGAYTLLFQGSTGLKRRIRSGEFDRFMLRPVNLTTQILSGQINFAGLCTIITACAVIIYAVRSLSWELKIGSVLLFGGNLLLGVCIRVNMEMTAQSLAFCLVDVPGIQHVLYEAQNYAKYPLTIYPKALRVVFVTVLPHAVISYVPVCLLIKRMEIWPFILGVPASALFITGLRRLVFNAALKRYESTGN